MARTVTAPSIDTMAVIRLTRCCDRAAILAAGCSCQGCAADLLAAICERRLCPRAPVEHARDDFVVAAAAWTLGEDEGAGGIMAGNGGAVSTWTSARC